MTAMLVLVIRIVLILLVVRFVVRFVAAVVRGYAGTPAPAAGGPHPVELVRDEMCNTFVPRSRALVAQVGGRTEHFCSTTCRDRALALAARS